MAEWGSVDGPMEVLERRRRSLVVRDMEAFADLFADDAVIEVPFAAEGMPSRLDGRDAIREFAAHAARLPLEIVDLRTVQIHETTDPEVVIIELVTEGRVAATGRRFEVPCIQVFRIRDGKILLFRDYAGAGRVELAG